jgi:hypothetical protein
MARDICILDRLGQIDITCQARAVAILMGADATWPPEIESLCILAQHRRCFVFLYFSGTARLRLVVKGLAPWLR